MSDLVEKLANLQQTVESQLKECGVSNFGQRTNLR